MPFLPSRLASALTTNVRRVGDMPCSIPGFDSC
jgi:hypothetical protein